MSLTTFLYTLKVWLSAVFIAPLLFCTGMCFNMGFSHVFISQMLSNDWDMYEPLLMFGAAFSFPTYLIFLLAIMIAMKSTGSTRRRKLIVSVIAVILAIATFAGFFYLFQFHIDRSLVCLIVSYCACIGAGSWYYKLEAEEKPDLEISPIEQ